MIQVTAGLIERDGKYLIARKKRGNIAGKWEFPGGKIEPGETPEECLKREIYEELGIEIRVGDFLAASEHEFPQISIELLGYHATFLEGTLRLIDHDRIEWVTPDEMDDYDFAPADLPFIAALQEK